MRGNSSAETPEFDEQAVDELALDGDPLADLFGSLALCERFGVYLLICPTPRAATEALRELPEQVGGRAGHPIRVIRLDPYDGMTALEPVASERILDRVVAPLLDPQPADLDPHCVWVMDASRAALRDEQAWFLAFGRLNECRNIIRDRLGRPLVLCLPPFLERVFAHAAPDFWSIRSLIARAEHGQIFAHIPHLLEQTRALFESGNSPAPASKQEVEDRLSSARELAAAYPDDYGPLIVLLAWLEQFLIQRYADGLLAEARRAAEEFMDAADRLWKKSGVAIFALLYTSAMTILAKICIDIKDFNSALNYVNSAISLRRDLIIGIHEVPKELLITAGRLGLACSQLACPNLAIEAYDQEILLAQAAAQKEIEGKLLILKGNTELEMDQDKEALLDSQLARSIFQEIRNRHGEATALLLAAKSYQKMKKYRDSAHLAKQALKIGTDLKDAFLTGTSYALLGWRNAQKKNWQRAVDYYIQAIGIFRNAANRMLECIYLSELGWLALPVGDLKLASETVNAIRPYIHELEDGAAKGMVLLNVAAVMLCLEQRAEVIALVEQALDLFERSGNPRAENTRAVLAGLRETAASY